MLQSRGLQPWEEVCGGPFVCFRPFRLLGRDYARGDPVPLDAEAAAFVRAHRHSAVGVATTFWMNTPRSAPTNF
jgi:hypothetical protein